MKVFYLGLALILLFKFDAHSQNTVWSTSQNIGIGTTSPSYPFQIYNSTARSVNSGVFTDFGFESYLNTDWQGPRLYFGRARGTVGSPLAVQSTDVLGWLDFFGSDGTALRRAGQIVFRAEGTPSSGIVPGMILLCTAGTDGVNAERMRINSVGNIGIGTSDTKGYKLGVNGGIIANAIVVKVYPWADYVFKPDYELPALSDVKSYIDQNHHLPEIPSEAEVAKNGLNLGEMNKLLMKKVEELTLYLIEKDEKDITQNEKIITEGQIVKQQESRIAELEKQVKILLQKSSK